MWITIKVKRHFRPYFRSLEKKKEFPGSVNKLQVLKKYSASYTSVKSSRQKCNFENNIIRVN